jgi:hypothetical protein
MISQVGAVVETSIAVEAEAEFVLIAYAQVTALGVKKARDGQPKRFLFFSSHVF